LSGNENDNISNEACCEHYSNFFLKNAEFVCSVDTYLSVVKKRFLDEEGAENLKYKFGEILPN